MLAQSVGSSKFKVTTHTIQKDPGVFFEEGKDEIFLYATSSSPFCFEVLFVNG